MIVRTLVSTDQPAAARVPSGHGRARETWTVPGRSAAECGQNCGNFRLVTIPPHSRQVAWDRGLTLPQARQDDPCVALPPLSGKWRPHVRRCRGYWGRVGASGEHANTRPESERVYAFVPCP
jgi:hypothetical protein